MPEKRLSGSPYRFPASHHGHESLDILVPESNAFMGVKYGKVEQIMNWLNFFLLGFITGVIAFGIDEFEEFLVQLVWRNP